MDNDRQNKDLNRNKGMNPGSGIHDQGKRNAPSRGTEDDLSTGGRSGGGVQGSQRDFDREDKEREQPGSKQSDRNKNY